MSEKVENKELRIVKVEEITSKNGNKFTAFKAVQKNGKLIDVRFRRDCPNKPDHPCIILVENDQWNLDKNRLYPCIWIKSVLATREFEFTNDEEDIF